MIKLGWLILFVSFRLQTTQKLTVFYNQTSFEDANKYCQDNFQSGSLVVITSNETKEAVKKEIYNVTISK